MRWNDAEDAEVLKLSDSGLTARQVAGKMGRSYDSVRHRLKTLRSGEAERQKRSPWTDSAVSKLKRMNERGVSPADMASMLGLTKNAVLGQLFRMRHATKRREQQRVIDERRWKPREKVHYQVHPMWSMPEEERRMAFYEKFKAGWAEVQERLEADHKERLNAR